ncbi:hypothetical protein QE152_g22095 [Popillia japonica]|uniref:Uncharacterized protein n=1 Tax=Popillia japonica TaxID=7064 RepID=A0AAW1KJP2_POPJA
MIRKGGWYNEINPKFYRKLNLVVEQHGHQFVGITWSCPLRPKSTLRRGGCCLDLNPIRGGVYGTSGCPQGLENPGGVYGTSGCPQGLENPQTLTSIESVQAVFWRPQYLLAQEDASPDVSLAQSRKRCV